MGRNRQIHGYIECKVLAAEIGVRFRISNSRRRRPGGPCVAGKAWSARADSPGAYYDVKWSLSTGCTKSLLKLRWTLRKASIAIGGNSANSKTVIDKP